jgi:hypothetical protein
VSLIGKEGNAMKSRSHIALAFIGFVATCAEVLFLAVLSSRMKIKLPGLNGNMR